MSTPAVVDVLACVRWLLAVREERLHAQLALSRIEGRYRNAEAALVAAWPAGGTGLFAGMHSLELAEDAHDRRPGERVRVTPVVDLELAEAHAIAAGQDCAGSDA
jgi:hypothetical protein